MLSHFLRIWEIPQKELCSFVLIIRKSETTSNFQWKTSSELLTRLKCQLISRLRYSSRGNQNAESKVSSKELNEMFLWGKLILETFNTYISEVCFFFYIIVLSIFLYSITKRLNLYPHDTKTCFVLNLQPALCATFPFSCHVCNIYHFKGNSRLIFLRLLLILNMLHRQRRAVLSSDQN